MAAGKRTRWRNLALVGLGGAIGTAGRAGLEQAYPAPAGAWPWTTFAINVVGAFLLGLLLETLMALPDGGTRSGLRLALGTGVLGGFTTYSTFALETNALADASHLAAAAGYAAATVAAGLTAAALGIGAARVVRRSARRHEDLDPRNGARPVAEADPLLAARPREDARTDGGAQTHEAACPHDDGEARS